MRDHILVIGGYGHVGQTICKRLGEQYPGKVYAAGRSWERAEAFSRTTDQKVLPLAFDIAQGLDPSLVNQVKLVVMCLDQTDTAFLRFCLEHSIHYVDVSASFSYLEQAERLHGEASANRATAVLSVGLAPGMSNLLARHAKQQLDVADEIDISILLGMGDRHGKAAIEWTVDNLGTRFHVVRKGRTTEVSSFTDGKKTNMGASLGERAAYRFNFSDQHTLPHTLGVPSVSTRLCFDSRSSTQLLALLRKIGFFNLLKLKPVRSAAVWLFGRLRFGTDIFAVKIDAWGKRGKKTMRIESLLQGNNEADMTAQIAASVATILYGTELPPGVYHIDQLFDLDTVTRPLGLRTVTIETVIP
ncbi:saccharopine dehydrogenase family protein [Paenibacillus sp. YIM B09110]|uniref:saccharopine dehydrogenase family protein n=1 Tax=Paenibacillus sp. YIM B09110 TaxID=3126102 RepID=UPI00301B9DE3